MFGTDIDYETWDIRVTVRDLQESGKSSKQPLAYIVPQWVPVPMWHWYKAGIEQSKTSSRISSIGVSTAMTTARTCYPCCWQPVTRPDQG